MESYVMRPRMVWYIRITQNSIMADQKIARSSLAVRMLSDRSYMCISQDSTSMVAMSWGYALLHGDVQIHLLIIICFVQIYDGNSFEDPILYNLNGENAPSPFISTTGTVLVQFLTESCCGTESGFQIQYYYGIVNLRILPVISWFNSYFFAQIHAERTI